MIHSFVFSKDPGYKITQKAMNTYYGFFRNFVSIGLSTGNGIVFFVGLALIFACIFSYRRTVKNDYDLVKCATYIPLFMFGIFFSFISFHPQWVIILVPFIVLCSFVNKDFKLSMFIDIVISIGYLCF